MQMVDWSILFLNFTYAIVGAVICLVFMWLGYVLFNRITPFDTHHELDTGNVAVGIVIGSIFVGLGVAIGLVIGLGLN